MWVSATETHSFDDWWQVDCNAIYRSPYVDLFLYMPVNSEPLATYMSQWYSIMPWYVILLSGVRKSVRILRNSKRILYSCQMWSTMRKWVTSRHYCTYVCMCGRSLALELLAVGHFCTLPIFLLPIMSFGGAGAGQYLCTSSDMVTGLKFLSIWLIRHLNLKCNTYQPTRVPNQANDPGYVYHLVAWPH